MTKTRVPAVEGMFTMDEEPHLIGGKVPGRETYFFPKHLAGGDPAAVGAELEEVLLSRRGRVWSYTSSDYPPPPPFVPATDPYEPITIAAVELEKEQMVVLGQCVAGVGPADLSIGDEVELVVEPLHEDDDHEYMVWKWRPVAANDGEDG
ncbi:MAG: benzoylsuccinyl-CoA thiolase [Actinobacteria bacterium]|nr:benzoylsuccinyl-CoA thiolase [Actinomycetota bacterium]NIS34572.1 benzoylsuccinyl-CoA thiolase [Actinomycetota bacterium]NIT97598.1 benzoylsuccinyl-CoA thiolase [Actinomycetota bacterium]NIU21251.1 benzoylsuccinyl-CoA thiolase [Actinomycetota bacterium]NIU69336.1 benzoylsuccinyl-CoA thiolase [Actinomycetota bacterium]